MSHPRSGPGFDVSHGDMQDGVLALCLVAKTGRGVADLLGMTDACYDKLELAVPDFRADRAGGFPRPGATARSRATVAHGDYHNDDYNDHDGDQSTATQEQCLASSPQQAGARSLETAREPRIGMRAAGTGDSTGRSGTEDAAAMAIWRRSRCQHSVCACLLVVRMVAAGVLPRSSARSRRSRRNIRRFGESYF